MSITDELRTGGIYRPASNRRYFTEEELAAIADRIDAEADDNERFRREAEPFCDRLREAASELADVAMFGADYGPLPVDANGEAIHIGDVMENIVCPPVHRMVTGVGDECFYAWEDGCGRYSQFGANCYRHHHKPTVEDVLRELVAAYMDTPLDDSNDGEFFAEYAAKLRLASAE